MALGAFNCVSNHARLLSVAEAGPSNLPRYLVADRGHFNWVARSHRLTRENSNAPLAPSLSESASLPAPHRLNRRKL
jgi:hypothetical protein